MYGKHGPMPNSVRSLQNELVQNTFNISIETLFAKLHKANILFLIRWQTLPSEYPVSGKDPSKSPENSPSPLHCLRHQDHVMRINLLCFFSVFRNSLLAASHSVIIYCVLNKLCWTGTDLYIATVESSATRVRLDVLLLKNKSFAYIKKNNGPWIEPWGTHTVITLFVVLYLSGLPPR